VPLVARKPGWYDDPEGLPGVYRWWDGQRWTVDITTDPETARAGDDPSTLAFVESSASASTDPTGTMPVPSAEPVVADRIEPSGSVPRTSDAPTAKTSSGSTYGGPVALTVVIVLTVAGITASIASSIVDSVPDSDDAGSSGVGVPDFDLDDIPRGAGADGRYDGGGLTYDAIRGRWTRSLMIGGVPMNDLDGEETVVAESARGGAQYAYVWLGSVESALVDDDLETTAGSFADRFARIGYPADARLDDSATEESIRVGGADAARLTRHYAYDVPGTPITGEELIVVVVDTGDAPAVWIASVPDGFPAVRRQAHQAMESLRLGRPTGEPVR